MANCDYFSNHGFPCDATAFHSPRIFTNVSVHTYCPLRSCVFVCALIDPCPTTIAVSPKRRTFRSSILNSVNVASSASIRFGNELSRLRRASAQSCWILTSACSSPESCFTMPDRLPDEAASQTRHGSLDPAEQQPQEMRIGKFCFRSLPHNGRL